MPTAFHATPTLPTASLLPGAAHMHISEQNIDISAKRVEQHRHKQRESEKELENLFGSLMQRWFG